MLTSSFESMSCAAARRVLLLCSLSVIGVHWYSCALYAVARSLSEADRPNWVDGMTKFETPAETWSATSTYLIALNRAVLTLLANGDHGVTHEEVAVHFAGVLAGLFWIAYFTSEMVEMVSSANEIEERARQKITLVAAFMREARLPAELISRCHRHLTTVLLHRRLALNTEELFSELSAPLRAEVALHRCHKVILSPNFMEIIAGDGGQLEPAFVKELVMRLEPVTFAPCDYALEAGDVGNDAFFLSSGRAVVLDSKGVELLALPEGACFGEIALLVPGVRRTASVMARSFCEALRISRQDFDDTLSDFPELKSNIKNSARRATERARCSGTLASPLAADATCAPVPVCSCGGAYEEAR
jgi:voltage-gated potassium channel